MTEMGERMDFEKGFNKYLHLKLLDEVADCKREQLTRFKCSEGTPFLCVVQTDFGRKIVYLHR